MRAPLGVEASSLPGVRTPAHVCPGSLPAAQPPAGSAEAATMPTWASAWSPAWPLLRLPVRPHRASTPPPGFPSPKYSRVPAFPPHALSWSPVPTEERLLPSTGTEPSEPSSCPVTPPALTPPEIAPFCSFASAVCSAQNLLPWAFCLFPRYMTSTQQPSPGSLP